MDGDTAAFDRAMKLIADTLAADPDHAEALVWRGDGRLFLAVQAFQRGATAEGQALTAQGTADMDRAVALAPNDIAVRVPRAAGLLPFARGMRRVRSPRSGPDDPNGHRRLRVRGGRQHALVEQAELSMAAASCWGRWPMAGCSSTMLPRPSPYLDRMTNELPDTPYAKNATLRRADPASRVPLTCLGCH